MAARAYWQGQIRLALVSIPVEIYTATKSGAQIAFNQIHEPSGKRIRYEKVVEGVGPVDRDEIVKGYEVSKGNYVLLDQDEIDAVRIDSRKTLELVQFVDQGEIDVFYFEKPYYVVPADDLAEEAFIVLREALKETKKVAIGQLSLRGREYLVSLKPCAKGIVLETLRYEDEVRRAQGYFKDIPDDKPGKEMLDLAKSLIDQKTAPFEPGKYRDRYVDALENLIAKKAKVRGKGGGKKILEDVEEPAPSRGGNVIDLMAALKKAVGEEKKGGRKAPAKKSPPSSAKGKKRASG